MDRYPESLGASPRSKRSSKQAGEVGRTTNGAAYGYLTSSSRRSTFNVSHDLLATDDATYDACVDFLNDHINQDFEFVWPLTEEVFVVRWTGDFDEQPVDGQLVGVSFTLVEI